MRRMTDDGAAQAGAPAPDGPGPRARQCTNPGAAESQAVRDPARVRAAVGDLSAERLVALRRLVFTGFYDRDAVIRRIAERIHADPDLRL